MTVQAFLQSLNLDDLVKAYCLYENDICNYHGTGNRKFHEDTDAVKKAFEKILSLEPVVDENSIVFSIPELGTQSLDSFIVKKEELFDTELERIEHYGYEFDSMREILGYQISKACRFQLNDDLLYACSILFEMTFFGYDPDYQEHETSKNIDKLNEQIEELFPEYNFFEKEHAGGFNMFPGMKNSVYGYSDEELDKKVSEVMEYNKRRQAYCFPKRYKVNSDGSREVLFETANKFDVEEGLSLAS